VDTSFTLERIVTYNQFTFLLPSSSRDREVDVVQKQNDVIQASLTV